jgi:hypothetical protein
MDGERGLYRPLTTLTYLLNHAVLGSADRPAGYHWFNLIVHVTNVLLLWTLAARVSGRAQAAEAVGVFAKESVVALVAVIVLYEIAFWQPRRSVRPLAASAEAIAINLQIDRPALNCAAGSRTVERLRDSCATSSVDYAFVIFVSRNGSVLC